MADERWFTVEQIADLLQVHPETVRSWLRAGRLKGRAFGGKTGWRVRESVLNAFLEREDRPGKAAA
jgi:excisionase family DNA binding protein